MRKFMLNSNTKCIESRNELRMKAYHPTRAKNSADLEAATATWEADISKYELAASNVPFDGDKLSTYVTDIVPLNTTNDKLNTYVNEKYEDMHDLKIDNLYEVFKDKIERYVRRVCKNTGSINAVPQQDNNINKSR